MNGNQAQRRPTVGLVSHTWSPHTGAGRCAQELRSILTDSTSVELALGPRDVPDRVQGRGAAISRLLRAWKVFVSIRKREVDVVVVNTTVQATVVLAARLAGARVIWWCHESGEGLSSLVMKARLLVYSQLAHTMVAVSSAVPRTRVPVAYIRNIVEEQNILEVPRPGTRLLVLGTKSVLKGTDRLPKILQPSLEGRPLDLLVIGDEDPREALHLRETRDILESRWGPHLSWLPNTSDPEEAYATADALLLPSRADTRPRVVEEALARGIPVIASDLPGLRDIADTVTTESALTLVTGDTWTPSVQFALNFGRGNHSYIETFSSEEFEAAWLKVLLAGPDAGDMGDPAVKPRYRARVTQRSDEGSDAQP